MDDYTRASCTLRYSLNLLAGVYRVRRLDNLLYTYNLLIDTILTDDLMRHVDSIGIMYT